MDLQPTVCICVWTDSSLTVLCQTDDIEQRQLLCLHCRGEGCEDSHVKTQMWMESLKSVHNEKFSSAAVIFIAITLLQTRKIIQITALPAVRLHTKYSLVFVTNI